MRREILRRSRDVLQVIPKTYDKWTLAATGLALNGISAVQIGHGFGLYHFKFGQKGAGGLSEVLYNSGQHPGPSFLGGIAVAAGVEGMVNLRDRYTKQGSDGRQTEAKRVIRFTAVTGIAALGMNIGNEFEELFSNHDVLGNKASGILSPEDLIVGTASPLLALGIAAIVGAVQNHRAQNSVAVEKKDPGLRFV